MDHEEVNDKDKTVRAFYTILFLVLLVAQSTTLPNSVFSSEGFAIATKHPPGYLLRSYRNTGKDKAITLFRIQEI